MEFNPFRIAGGGIVLAGTPPSFLGPHPGVANTITRVGAGEYRFTLSEPTDLGQLVVCCTSILPPAAGPTDDSYAFVREDDGTFIINSNAAGPTLADIDYAFVLIAILPS